MKPSHIKTIRRLALVAAIAITLIVTATYLGRRQAAEQARQAAATPIGEDVAQQAEKFTFSRSQEGQTLFTVEADRTTERAGKATVLENVVVYIYGQRGERHDEIRTARCEYDADGTQRILCPDQVTVQLRNPRAPDDAPDSSIRLTTSALQFDPEQSVAWTDQPVDFSFPGGSGGAVGLRYQPVEPRVQLGDGVTINVARQGNEPVQIVGTGLGYFAGPKAFELKAPLRVAVGERVLVADRLRMELDAQFRTRRIEAAGHARATTSQDGRRLTMMAARTVVDYGPHGSVESLQADGGVELESAGQGSTRRLTSEKALFSFDRDRRAVDRVVATGDCVLSAKTSTENRTLQAPELELRLRGNESREQLLLARRRGTLTEQRSSGSGRSVTADTLEIIFARQQLKELTASGNVGWQERRDGGSLRASSSSELRAGFGGKSELTSLEQWGSVRYEDARWKAEAGRADYKADSGQLVLTQQPAVWDAASRTTAQVIEIVEAADEVHARGEVRTTRWSGDAFGTGQPVQVSAARLSASKGTAIYDGAARLWQGQNRLAAVTIRFSGDANRLQADGEVSAVFLEGQADATGSVPARAVRITAGRFSYDERERLAVFEQNVRAQTDSGTLITPRLEAYLTGGGQGTARVERLQARQGVRFEQDGLRATSEEGEYRPEEQIVELWGGTPTLHHPQRGTTTGARLTLHLADATISIDSAEGVRTVTRRPWAQ